MSKKINGKNPIGVSSNDADEEIIHTLRKGWLLPKTDEEIEKAEKELELNPVELPQSLQDPYVIFERGFSMKANIFYLPLSHKENLAQAAREGKSIPPEIAEKMQNDRKKAQDSLANVRKD